MTRWVCLLRGINVGGNNLIKMTALAECLRSAGLQEVSTYIASGNVLFAHASADAAKLTGKIEQVLSKQFGYEARVVLRSHRELQRIVAKRPRGFGEQPAKYRYDVLFLKEPFTAKRALDGMPVKEGVDRILPGPGVLYASRLVARASESRISRIITLPVYRYLTIRNWNTTSKLLALLDAISSANPAP